MLANAHDSPVGGHCGYKATPKTLTHPREVGLRKRTIHDTHQSSNRTPFRPLARPRGGPKNRRLASWRPRPGSGQDGGRTRLGNAIGRFPITESLPSDAIRCKVLPLDTVATNVTLVHKLFPLDTTGGTAIGHKQRYCHWTRCPLGIPQLQVFEVDDYCPLARYSQLNHF